MGSLIQYVMQIMINNQHTRFILQYLTNLLLLQQWARSAMTQVNDFCLLGAKPLPVPVLTCCQLDPWEHIPAQFQ